MTVLVRFGAIDMNWVTDDKGWWCEDVFGMRIDRWVPDDKCEVHTDFLGEWGRNPDTIYQLTTFGVPVYTGELKRCFQASVVMHHNNYSWLDTEVEITK